MLHLSRIEHYLNCIPDPKYSKYSQGEGVLANDLEFMRVARVPAFKIARKLCLQILISVMTPRMMLCWTTAAF